MDGSRSKIVARGTIAGVVAGCAIAVALVATGTLRIPVLRDQRDASTDFLRAWERSRRGTFVVESDFRRRLADGRTLYSVSKLAQRPPDRLIRQFGGLDGVINGHPVVCSTDQGGTFSCFAGSGQAPDFDRSVARELDTFRSYFADPDPDAAATSSTSAPPPVGSTPGSAPGSTPGTTVPEPLPGLGLYRAFYAPESGCFELFQKIRYPDAPYGTYAKFCFDGETGAMRLLERHLANGVVESLTATRVSPVVGPADFDTSEDEQFDLRMDLGEFQPPPTPEGGTTPGSGPPDELARQSNNELLAGGSAVVDRGEDPSPYVREAVRRLERGQLSINSPAWLGEDGRARALLQPVVLDLLGTGIYYGPT